MVKTIFIGFSKPKNSFFPIFSWAIRLIEKTNFSHVYVRHATHYNIDIIYQASGHAVNFESGELFFKKAQTVKEFEFRVSDEAFDAYMSFALRNVGKPYGIKQIFGIFLLKIFKLKSNPFKNGSADYVCSELVAEILYELGLYKYDRETFDRLTPSNLFRFCVQYKFQEVTK